MEYKCEVLVSSHWPQVKSSMLNYKQEWAELLMKAEDATECLKQGNGQIERPAHRVKAELIAISGDMGTVILDHGILLQMPLFQIRVKEK